MADKYDIHFQPVPSDEVKGFQCFEFGFAAPLQVKGLQSLVNRWVKTFMTPKGSDPLYPSDGTSFGSLPGASISKLSSDLKDLTAIAISEASDQVKRQDIDGLYPLDEQLQSATLVQFNEVIAGFEVWINIKNVAGQSFTTLAATL